MTIKYHIRGFYYEAVVYSGINPVAAGYSADDYYEARNRALDKFHDALQYEELDPSYEYEHALWEQSLQR